MVLSKRIRDLVELLENFTNGFHELVKKLQHVVRDVFSNIIPNELAIRKFKICKIEHCLQQANLYINARKVVYKEIQPSEDQVDFYIENFGSLLFAKLDNLISMYDSLEPNDMTNVTKEESNDAGSIQETFQDVSFSIQEHFLRLHLLIKYVLYCTPRQHTDHRPLTQILNELNRINRRNYDRGSKQAGEKSMSLPVDTNDGVSNKKKKTKIKRRYSLDSSALRKLGFMSRGLGFGRKSSQPLKQDTECELIEKSYKSHNELTDSHYKRQFSAPWHSSPYSQMERNETGDVRNCRTGEDKETSFDVYKIDCANSTIDYSNGSCTVEDSAKNTLERQCNVQGYEDSRQNSKKFTVGNSPIGSNRTKSTGHHGNWNIGDDKSNKVGESPNDSKLRCNSNHSVGCDVEVYAKMEAKSLTNYSTERGSKSADMQRVCSSCCAHNLECSHKTRGNSFDNDNQLYCTGLDQRNKRNDSQNDSKSCDLLPNTRKLSYDRQRSENLFDNSMPSSHQGYCESIVKDSGCESGEDVDQLNSSHGYSPTLLKRQISQNHSPTLLHDLDTNVYLYPLDSDPIPDQKLKKIMPEEKRAKQNMVGMDSKPRERERDHFVFRKDENSMTGLTLAPHLYTGDKRLCLDNHQGKQYPGNHEIYRERNSIPRETGVKDRDEQDNSRSSQFRTEKSAVRMAREKFSGSQSSEKHTPDPRDIQVEKETCESSVIEESNKSIVNAVARARKRLKNLASPKLFRKREVNMDSFSKKSGAITKQERFEGAHVMNMSSSGDSSYDKYVGFRGTKQASLFSVDNSFERSFIVGSVEHFQNANDGSYHDVDYKCRKVEVGSDLSTNITPRLCRGSSSASNDLSISSDFHSTVTKILRSNSITSGSPVRLGFSTFYCKAETDMVRVRGGGSSSGSDDSSLIHRSDAAEGKDEISSGGSCSMKYPSSDSNVKADRYEESISLGGGQTGCTPKEQTNPIRLSRSEPAFRNNESAEKIIPNGTSESLKYLQNFRKIPKTRISSWSQNFDLLLSDKVGVKVFAEFLRSEYSEENLKFWLACEDFKSLKGNKIAKNAQKIYKSFIEICSASEVNLDHQTRTKIRQCLLSPSKNMFNTAQSRIKELMAQDSYQRFIKSQLYENLLML